VTPAVKRLLHTVVWIVLAAVVVGALIELAWLWLRPEAFASSGMQTLLMITLGVLALIGCAHVYAFWRIAQLNETLRKVADGDLERTLPPAGRDQIGQLTSGIEGMVATLRSNYDDLKRHDELRRQLVANVSHELRTPLTSIQGYLETTALAGAESPDFSQNLEICQREAKKLSRLVQDLFELSKLDTEQLEFRFEPVPLVEMADQVGLAFVQRFADKMIEFETEFADDALEVWGDGNRLSQVVTNLLGNAAVFTPEGGKVTLACARDGNRAVLTVSDTGVGIPEKDIPHIFESFFHLEKSRTRNLGGTGLGLAICKAIVEKHRGEITVRSRVGQGTTFTVSLDLLRPTVS